MPGKLLPCPFCGGPVEAASSEHDDETVFWFIECRCGAAVEKPDELALRQAWNWRQTVALPISMHARRWRVGDDSGEVFDLGAEFDGLTVTIELRSSAEAAAVSAALAAAAGAGRPAVAAPAAPFRRNR